MNRKVVCIGDEIVGDGHPVYIVAEIGINHNGDIDIAKKLIDVAHMAGCNAVKFQKRVPIISVREDQKNAIRDTPWGMITYLEYKNKIEFGASEYKSIANYCKNKILWFASPWDSPSVEFLENFNVPCYKIPSASITQTDLLDAVKNTGKPIIISTGMSTMAEIEKCINRLGGTDNLIILHCNSSYPAKNDELNLRVITRLREKYDCPIGYSGHEVGLQTTYAAVSLGACMVERHITHFARDINFDLLVTVQATSPLLRSEDLDAAITQFNEGNYDSMLTAVIFKRFLWSINGTPLNYDYKNRPTRQVFDGCFMENGAFYITKKQVLLENKNRLGGNIGIFLMAPETAIEIDEPSDWFYVDHLLMQRRDRNTGLGKIKFIVTDVDGTLTDGGMYYTADGELCKKFNTRDGKGIELARKHGIETCILTAENSLSVLARAKKLNVKEVHIGVNDKMQKLVSICKEKKINLDDVLYIGDDINDLECMKICGYKVCPQDAVNEVKKVVDYVCRAKGGDGVLREAVAIIIMNNHLNYNGSE